jgi:histone H3/H4
MKKKLDTRFPAARIKKIMQADEEVGKIAMATPVLISKALELFLQNLCDKTYEITLRRGAKTMSSIHLKQCVQTNSVFDFLQEIVSKVPDIGPESYHDERNPGRRRYVVLKFHLLTHVLSR